MGWVAFQDSERPEEAGHLYSTPWGPHAPPSERPLKAAAGLSHPRGLFARWVKPGDPSTCLGCPLCGAGTAEGPPLGQAGAACLPLLSTEEKPRPDSGVLSPRGHPLAPPRSVQLWGTPVPQGRAPAIPEALLLGSDPPFRCMPRSAVRSPLSSQWWHPSEDTLGFTLDVLGSFCGASYILGVNA